MSAVRTSADADLGVMNEDEVNTLRQWAVAEGWNPGISDIAIARAYDPDAFIALRQRGDLVGGGAILRYGASYGFMGLFIMRHDLRQQGLGNRLWLERRTRLQQRLNANALIGMDGVVHMVPYYERGGFTHAGLDIRFEGAAHGAPSNACSVLTPSDFLAVAALDASCFPTDRSAFLARWLDAPGMKTAVLKVDGVVRAFGALRPAETGFKFGPVLSVSPSDAHTVIAHLLSQVTGSQVQLDVPDTHVAAIELAKTLGLKAVFRCAKMYLGQNPSLKTERIFGLTSFEFG